MRGELLTVVSIGALIACQNARAEAVAAAPAGQAAAPSKRYNTTGRDIPLGGPLTDDGFILGDISYTLTGDDRLIVDAPAFLALLKPSLAPDVWSRLATAVGPRQEISGEELAALGFTVAYDQATFGLKLSLAPELRPRRTISVTGGYGPTIGALAEPSPFSAYVTAYGNIDYVHRGFDRGLATPNIQLDSAIRYRGLVLENEASVQDRFSRQATRLVYDDLARTARYSAGDLEPISRGFSGVSPMAGASIVRVYSDLEPQRNIQPRGQRSFTLVRPSTVETFVNGQSVQQTRLNPGTYNISDFPFAQGSNDVRLVIRDDTGAENVISFSINFDRSLLAKGLSEFGLYAGVRAPFRISSRTYTDTPIASGFYRRGFTDELTAGGNFQVSTNGGVGGVEVIWAAPVGTIGVNLAASNIDRIGNGYALNVGYERIFGSGSNVKSLTATFQTTSRDFATPSNAIASNPFAYEIGASYSQGIARDHYVSLDGYYSIGRGSTPNQVTTRATYGWRSNRRILLTAEAAYERRPSQHGFGLRIALTYRFDRESSAQAEADTLRDRQRLTYQRAEGRGVGAYNVSANVDRNDDAVGLNGTATYIGNRAEIGAAHLTAFSTDNGNIIDQRTSFRFGTSLAFAGGHVALSRPIYDSFAIVAPHKSLDGATVYVDPREDRDLARSGLFGGAVAPDLSPYFPRVLTYDVPKAPAGYNLGTGTVTLVPPYRSGYFVEVGSDYSVTYTGILRRRDGAPVSLLAGKAIELARPQRAPVGLFTNRAGRFVAEGLRPGKWRIEFPNQDEQFVIEVPADAKGLVDGGEIRPEGAQ